MLRKIAASSFADATGSDLRACAYFNLRVLHSLLKVPFNVGLTWIKVEMFASQRKSRSLSLFPVRNLRSELELMHIIAHMQI